MTENVKIEHIDYSIHTRSIDIFTIGCNGDCKGCCNPEIKDWGKDGMDISHCIDKVIELDKCFNKLVDRIFIVGGDPVDAFYKNKQDIKLLINSLRVYVDKPIYLFTRYELREIPEELKNIVDYIKTGAYIPELATEDNIQYGIKLATSNQKIYKHDWKKVWSVEND